MLMEMHIKYRVICNFTHIRLGKISLLNMLLQNIWRNKNHHTLLVEFGTILLVMTIKYEDVLTP